MAMIPEELEAVHFSEVGNPDPGVPDVDDPDPDDELLDETPADVVAILGFDPCEPEDDDENDEGGE